MSQKEKYSNENGPLFVNIDENDPEYIKTVQQAQTEIEEFKNMLLKLSEGSIACVKIYIPENDKNGAFIWLNYPKFMGDTCTAQIFEIPGEFVDLKPGMRLKFLQKEIQDWFIISKDEKMVGGYSIRYQRSKISRKRYKEFDEYIGVKKYI